MTTVKFYEYSYMPYVEDGMVSMRVHPEDDDIVILNYTNRCVWAGLWDEITSMTRGLIVRRSTGEILGLPFSKFFNYKEHGVNHSLVEHDTLPPDYIQVEATVKYDGILGISYRHNGKIQWATKGMLKSKITDRMSEIWDSKYSHIDIPDHITLLIELISPDVLEDAQDKLIIKYDFDNEFVIVGARNRLNGYDLWHSDIVKLFGEQGIRIAETVKSKSIKQLAEDVYSQGLTTEGVVLRWGLGKRMKIKTEAFFKYSKSKTIITDSRILLDWKENRLDTLYQETDSDFWRDIKDKEDDLNRQRDEILSIAREKVNAIRSEMPDPNDSKEFFIRLDTKDKQLRVVELCIFNDRENKAYIMATTIVYENNKK